MCIRDSINGEQEERDIYEMLKKRYKCPPLKLGDLQEKCSKFIQELLKPLVENRLKMSYDLYLTTQDLWTAFVETSKRVKDQLAASEMIERTLFIDGVEYILVPSLISAAAKKPSIHFNLSQGFPTVDVLTQFPYRQEIILSLLCCDTLTFSKFEEARTFLDFATENFNVRCTSHKGRLCLHYQGRYILIRTGSSNTLDLAGIQELQKTEVFSGYVNEFTQRFCSQNTIVLVSDDEIASESLDSKIVVLKTIMESCPTIFKKTRVQFINIYHPNEENSAKPQDLKHLRDKLTAREVTTQTKTECIITSLKIENSSQVLALYSIADLFLNTITRLSSISSILEFIAVNAAGGLALTTHLTNVPPNLASVIKVNPYFINKTKLEHVVGSTESDNLGRLNQDKTQLSKYSFTAYLDNYLQDIEYVYELMRDASYVNKGSGLLLRRIAVSERSKLLNMKEVLDAYAEAENRVIVIDYEDVLVDCKISGVTRRARESQFVNPRPSKAIIEALETLSADHKNTCFIITSKTQEYLDTWFSSVKNLGLASENGFFYKINHNDSKWSMLFRLDWGWREIVKSVLDNYTQRTEGSYIDVQESCIAWRFEAVVEEFANIQAAELENHLKSLLEYMQNIEVIRTKDSVEVRPAGVNKGITCDIILRKTYLDKGNIDFLLNITSCTMCEETLLISKKQNKGSNELFSNDAKLYFASVGKKSNMIPYILTDTREVEQLLTDMAKMHHPNKMKLGELRKQVQNLSLIHI
eukprot:TRINITY_DN5392_c0_g1_i1.p1 TRINITY_DN5392_c0_g1~~TRINITY_DN5392_c0_g1_i1.p1  ORF type:complete len:775 (+),score=192.96 TRINITY_DN5392_c0_g1_i1:61-2325(+)